MYFALEYFLQREPRPPVGAAVTGAKDWWRDNPIAAAPDRRTISRAGRLAIGPEFGPALSRLRPRRPTPSGHSSSGSIIRSRAALARSSMGSSAAASTAPSSPPSAASGTTRRPPTSWSSPTTGCSTWRRPRPRCVRAVRARCWSAASGWSARLRSCGCSRARLARRRLDRVRGKRRRPDGRPAMVRPARGPHPRGGRRAHRRQEAHLVHPRSRCSSRAAAPIRARAPASSTRFFPRSVAGRLIVWTEATSARAPRASCRCGRRCAAFSTWSQLEPQLGGGQRSRSHAQVARRLSDRRRLDIRTRLRRRSRSAPRANISAPQACPASAIHAAQAQRCRARPSARTIAPQDVLEHAVAADRPAGLDPRYQGAHRPRLRSATSSRARVIGQDEAVASVVERIAMLKAGLNDPGRPIGVFLFAGPTGTGKTELAKTAAEYLFGSVERLIRLDMSEFQTPELTANISRQRHDRPRPNSLISRVRKQPFSVVLLDEFEKSHPRIWDLFLQVFDEGRLTDTLGQVADFRHCLIIMTTNLGATSHQTLGARLCAGGRRLHYRAGHARDQPDLPARIPEPARQGHRVPAAHPRSHARDPAARNSTGCWSGAGSRTATGRSNGNPPRSSSCSRKDSRPRWARARSSARSSNM